MMEKSERIDKMDELGLLLLPEVTQLDFVDEHALNWAEVCAIHFA